jgi:hypothetical protein
MAVSMPTSSTSSRTLCAQPVASKTRGAKYAGITTFLNGEKQRLSTVAQTTAKPLTNLSIHIHMPELAVNLQRVFFTIFVFHQRALIPCAVDIAGRWGNVPDTCGFFER